MANDPTFDPDTITVKDAGISSDILAGDKILVPVWAFVARLENRPADEIANDYAGRIRQAIIAYQKAHSLTNLLMGVAKTVLAFLILAALIILVNRGVRRLNQAISAPEKFIRSKWNRWNFLPPTASRAWSSRPSK